MKISESITLFLVDDDPLFLKSLEHFLLHKLKHYAKIRSFESGEQCLRHLDEKPDIVVLDYVLNGNKSESMDGISVLRKIRDLYPSALVIMLSGQEKLDVAVESIRHGAYDYVIKNENAFLKIQNLLRNAMSSIALKRQVRGYNLGVKIIFVVIALMLITAIVIELFFKEILQ